MKRAGFLSLSFLMVFAFAIAGALSAFSKSDKSDSQADKRKASYLYIQALDAFMNERYNLYGELLSRAFDLDPDDPELITRYGEWLLLTNANDSATVERGFDMMLDGYSRHPADYFEGQQLLNLTSNYRRWDDNLNVSEMLHKQFPQRNEVSLQLGRSYLMHALMGDTSYIKPAVSVVNDLESKLGKSPQLSEMKIRALAVSRDTAAIVDELNALYASSPADVYTALSVGRIYNSLSKPDSALRYFNRACEIDSTNGNAILMRAQLYQQQGDSVTFDREVFRAIKSQDLELEAKLPLIVNYVNMLYTDSTQHQRIDNLFETLLDVNPGEPEIHRIYASYLLQTDRKDKAADQMEYVVSLEGTDRTNWLLLAQLYSDQKNYSAAAEALDRASKFFANDLDVVRPRAVLHSLAGDVEEAIDILRQYPDSLIADPEDKSELQSMLGDYYYRLEMRDRAFEAYDKALKYNPLNYMAMNNVAYYYSETDTLLDKAETYAERVVRHEPDNITYIDTYAWVLFKKGEFAKAKEQINLALEIVGFDAASDSIETIIDKHEPSAGDYETPAEELEETDPKQSASAEIYDHAGDIYYRCGDVQKAVSFWQKALSMNPDDEAAIKKKIEQRKITDDVP